MKHRLINITNSNVHLTTLGPTYDDNKLELSMSMFKFDLIYHLIAHHLMLVRVEILYIVNAGMQLTAIGWKLGNLVI